MQIHVAQKLVAELNEKMRGRKLVPGDLGSLLLHLEEEVEEVRQASDDELGEELADKLHFILAMAECRDIDLEREFYQKLKKNHQREWHLPDESGIIRHKSDDEA